MERMKNNFFLYLVQISFFLLLFLFTKFSFCQEFCAPLFAKSAESFSLKKRGSLDSSFIYISDTLNINKRFVDDFSQNHFQSYLSDYNDLNVYSKKYFKYLKLADLKPIDPTLRYGYKNSYLFRHDFVSKKDTVIPLPNLPLIFFDLSAYPIKQSAINCYPAYSLFDTIGGSLNIMDTVNLYSDIVQDSVVLFFSKLNDKNAFWLDSNAYRNDHYAVNPPTLGVVTFDGLNQYGYPYYINSQMRGYADYLTSKPFDLNGLKLKDSVYFSFLFQPKGFGDAPENMSVGLKQQHDSLCLQFYNPKSAKWISVWSSTVADNETDFLKESKEFKKVHFPILDSTFLGLGFQFRFVNFGDLSGSLDHFHLDYVSFKKFSGYQEEIFKDFALVYPSGSILKEYESVPWAHFLINQSDKLTDSLKISLRNLSNSDANNQSGAFFEVYDANSTLYKQSISGDILSNSDLNYKANTLYESFHELKNKFFFNSQLSSKKASFFVKTFVSAQFENLPENDFSIYSQVFEDFYAYDDGTAEAAYGLKSSHAQLAYLFDPYVYNDSLVGVSIHFAPSVSDKSNKIFGLKIWAENNGKPGVLLYEDDDFSLRQPIYQNLKNGFSNYYFKDYRRLPITGKFFIGLRQIDQDPLNIGFDRNGYAQKKLFYSNDQLSNWKSSNEIGSLMMRPVFQSNINNELSLSDQISIPLFSFSPNPASEEVNITSRSPNYLGSQLIDGMGRILFEFAPTQLQFSVSQLEIGTYFLKDKVSGITRKLIKL